MRFETPENVLRVEVEVEGVIVTLSKDVLKIDDLEIDLKDARE